MPTPNIQDFPRNQRKDDDSEKLRKLFETPQGFLPPTVVMCTKDFGILPGMKGLFAKGEKVILKGRTFQVVHLTNESVMLEPVPFVLENSFFQK